MAFMGKAKKADLRTLALELGEEVNDNLKIIELKDLILNSKSYEQEFVKNLLETIVSSRLKEEEEGFELQKLRLQLETQKAEAAAAPHEQSQVKLDLYRFMPAFNPQEDMSLFLLLFERQMKFLQISEDTWVTHLVGLLPPDVTKLIIREPEEVAKDYSYIRTVLLQRFKMSADQFRKLFSQHRKNPNSTWRDFYFELRNYFEGWLTELNVTSFEKLRDLMIADQMKKRCSPECREHFLDEWEELILPNELADKLDAYDNLRSSNTNVKKKMYDKSKGESSSCRSSLHVKGATPISREDKSKHQWENRPSLRCFGCGTPGYVRAKCPTCSKAEEEVRINSIQMYTGLSSTEVPLLDVSILGAKGAVCADTGASRSVAGELVYRHLQKCGLKFQDTRITMSLADGRQTTNQVLITKVPVNIRERTVLTDLIILPEVKGNRTFLGNDFLRDAGIVMNLRTKRWHFDDVPRQTFPFAKESFIPPLNNSASDADSKKTVAPVIDNPVDDVELNSCRLRKEEGQHLTESQRVELDSLLNEYERIFQPGGEATPYAEHHINTGSHPPVSAPPYRLSPAKKEILKKEIDDLLEKGVIEECESPYAAPVVLVPKPNGGVRLCVDYRKLNEITVPDAYPLPRMDDLMHDAKHTAFMSTIDLKAGYHQVNVYPSDRDKTAFVCPFGTFRYVRMPYGLRNAPATFQRLMDTFRRGIPSVKTLAYLDDVIILSSSFEQHIQDLRTVFDRLLKFNLNANREKCNFACSRVKYLGLWITPKGVEVDSGKISAILEIPPPKTVKQLQSFLQTCSWYRRFIRNFAEVSRPLSNLTKKKVLWSWTDREQSAFEMLKQCLVTSPILKQVDESKPFVIRTDASSYALGAVLLQGQGPEEHPIEYASRLLSPAERNYSTTEREALAVVWALGKFRGYIEGSEVTVATDHQALKWLMSLKSPSGRLARWALQLQQFNLKMEYLPGKSNVVADMLSRPTCCHEVPSCELCMVSFDTPTRSPKSIREEQLKDDDLRKIIECFENVNKDVNYANWTERGYLMNQGVLYRYAPSSEAEEAQLVVPSHERACILKEHHDAPTAGHYGAEGTYNRICQRYYWTGMRSYISNYVKNCVECSRYKPSNQKPAGLLHTPIYSQRFETISIDLFGPLPETKNGKKWIFIVEDCATKWVEIFPLACATAKECATTLLEEVILRYGVPRRIISDNGSQFVSAVMQQLCFLLDIRQSLTPLYHPQANPVERKNRDLKPRLAILVGDKHDSWEDKLPQIRFAMNTAKCDTTGRTPAFLQFGRELRTVDDVTRDIRAIIDNDNFVPEITPYLKRFARNHEEIKEHVEGKQDQRKEYFDQKRRTGTQFAPGDKVWVTLHPISKSSSQKTAKFMPRRDGPYIILTQRSPTTYEVAHPMSETPLGVYHVSALKPCRDAATMPIVPLRKRGRPPKTSAGSLPGRRRNQRGRL